MDVFLSLFKEMPLVVLGFIFMSLFFVFYIIQYIYISYNLKGICRIIFYDEKYFRLPLEPFNCFFISLFPIVFWRETLNIKKGFKFKKLYGKDFYYPVDKNQLNEMLLRYPKFFYIQYIIYFSVFISIIFLGIAYSLDKFF
ncbi:hypothetical protein J0904_17860 [Acinetobacter bereziniae]|uniref:hypothetical protein n=1 Tax=Acinetobacter bereziniae TaxID=106648 RepID=UPI002074ED3A|nr:hypothetical protein [Acinetobacter bereziniae]MCM8513967.1 hypothetical protein [Acinetobacter bereziniae]